MQSNHTIDHDEREQYEPPAVVELGTLATLTQGVVGFPSCQRD